MEPKLQLVDTAGGGRRVLTSCLSSFSSTGTLVDVSGGNFFFYIFFCENAVRKSDQSLKTTVKQKHRRKVSKFPSKIHFNAVFSVAKQQGRRPLGGITVILKWNAETEIGVVSFGGGVRQ